MKRKGIYVLRDKNGKVEECDFYLFKNVRKLCEDFTVFLCGDFELNNAKSKFLNYNVEVICTDFIKSDAAILKDVLEETSKNLVDELLFVNNSFFGPIMSFSDVFEKMSKQRLDFWGITKIGKTIGKKWTLEDAYLQMYFCVIKSNMLFSEYMERFWEEEDWNVAFEKKFTKYFSNKGFLWNSYIDIEKYYSTTAVNNFNILYDTNYELISAYQSPVLLKDCFTKKDLSYGDGSDLRETIRFIESNSEYDVEMIWDYILKHYNIAAIKDAMNLNYILPFDMLNEEVSDECLEKAVIIIHIGYPETIIDTQEYWKGIPEKIKKIFVVLDDITREQLLESCEQVQISNYEVKVMMPNRGRDMNSLFVLNREAWLQYDYLCFVHDKRTSGNTGAYTIGKAYMRNLWENTIKSNEYIKNVLNLFLRNPRMGFLAVPTPYYGNLIKTMGDEWTVNFEMTKQLAKEMGIRVDISKKHAPFALGNAFWCRTTALKKIIDFEIKTNDFYIEPMPEDGTISHALERLMIYAAQSEGYFSAIVENQEYAQIDLNNKNYMLRELMSKIFKYPQFAGRNNFHDIVDILLDSSFEKFYKDKERIYIYGTGAFGRCVARKMKVCGYVFDGFLCSDGYKKADDLEKEVLYVSEISRSNVGIIVAMNKKFYSEVMESLESFGNNIFYL